MVAGGKGEDTGGRDEGGMADIHENMINPCVYRRGVTRNLMEGVVNGRGTGQCGVRERNQDRTKTRPGLGGMGRGRGTTIPDRIRVRVPITHQEVKIRKESVLRSEAIEKACPSMSGSKGIDVGKLKDLPLEAKAGS